jgi:hypothetical protein
MFEHPDLASSHHLVFGSLRDTLKGHKFASDREMKESVRE